MSETSTSERGSEGRLDVLIGWAAVAALLALECYRRVVLGEIPPDMSAYLAAADVFSAGADPYGDALFDSPHYAGYPYVYPPGTLPLVALLDRLPPVAVALVDVFARAGILAAVMSWLARRFSVELPLSVLLALAVFYQPLVADFANGNLAIYLLGAFVMCAHLASSRWQHWHLPAGLAAGAVLAFKPMWGLAAGAAVLAARRWRAAACMLAGAGVLVGLTVLDLELVDSWQGRIAEIREFYRSFDLLSLAPPLLPVAVLGWVGAGVALMRRGVGRDKLWLWACVSVVAWPRLASYSYVLLIPVLVFFWQRWGWRRTLTLSLVAFGPIPWLALSHDAFIYLGALYGWALVLAGLLFAELWRGAPAEQPNTAPFTHTR